MKYEIVSVAMALIAIISTLALWPVCHNKVKAYIAWPKWDHRAGSSSEFQAFRRLHGAESYLSLGVVLPFVANLYLAELIKAHLIGAEIPQQWVLNYSVVTSGTFLLVALVICTFHECPPNRWFA